MWESKMAKKALKKSKKINPTKPLLKTPISYYK